MDAHIDNTHRAKPYDVFISYKRVDADIRDLVVEALEAAKITFWWDAKLQSGQWRAQLAERINACGVVIAIWSKNAAAAPKEVLDEMIQARGLDRLIILRTDDAKAPDDFRIEHFLPLTAWANDSPDREAHLAAIVADVRRRIKAPTYVVMPTGATISSLVAPPEFGDIPGAPNRLVGREAELKMLRDAWESKPPKKTNAVVLHALGGAGKSALLRTFANELLAAGGGGAKRIYGWSAYSQGSGEQKRADADGFITKALGDFGFAGDIPKDPIERARTLARLIQKERVLLLLDGLEPLQDPPDVNKGRFKDKGLAELIKILANGHPGLMVLTTRQEVPELHGRGSLVLNHPLDKLSPKAGADLLVELGVRGRQRDLEAAVASVDGHALSVTLLGTYLAEVCGGDVLHRDQFDFEDLVLSPDEQSALATDKTIIPAKRAAKVMRGYLDQFEKLAKDGAAIGLGGPERALLHLLGLFDRPADGPAVEKLLATRIAGLTDDLFVETVTKTTTSGRWFWKTTATMVEVRELSTGERAQRLRRAKERLRKLGLLSRANPKDEKELDAHPIVRAFFAGRLETTAPEAAKAAHELLYRHYAAAAPDLPDTMDEMQPLFHAVQHGVKAGRAQEVYVEVYQRRIDMLRGAYIVKSLGAFGPMLSTLSHFFDPPWRTPRRDLSPDDQAWLLSSAAFALTALGRLADSVEPQRAGLAACVASGDWANAARAGGNLTDTLLTLGRVDEAVPVAEAAVTHADRSRDEEQREFSRTTLAAALTAAGDTTRATDLYAEAEALRLVYIPNFPRFVSYQNVGYCDLLLARNQMDEVLDRGREQLSVATRYLGKGLGLDDIGYAHLLMGRAEDALGHPEAAASLDAAVAGLREAGTQNFLPRALLARAAHRRRRAAAGEAALIEPLRADLDEVADIAGEEMRLFLTDLALERARLALDVPSAVRSPEESAATQTALAAKLITETGYRRRDGELADLEARLAAG
jgi:tetratricopeptide (TPR) repeat protein